MFCTLGNCHKFHQPCSIIKRRVAVSCKQVCQPVDIGPVLWVVPGGKRFILSTIAQAVPCIKFLLLPGLHNSFVQGEAIIALVHSHCSTPGCQSFGIVFTIGPYWHYYDHLSELIGLYCFYTLWHNSLYQVVLLFYWLQEFIIYIYHITCNILPPLNHSHRHGQSKESLLDGPI